MSRIFHPLLCVLACATRQELARQVQYLKTENQILRSKLPQRITVTPEERRRLVKAGGLVALECDSALAFTTDPAFSGVVRRQSRCCVACPSNMM